ncbi:DNA/RNA helicase domain-containing protein [Levilactobacillus brevis]|uniref:DNA/RNA helicase domain-containing protein n=1 Tax=Levilactobacillus brevis TaxID=1580 RepID=UPI0020746FC8|nr:DNA/RNA helicase domain-containing protein [Levilactobacillus brevis]
METFYRTVEELKKLSDDNKLADLLWHHEHGMVKIDHSDSEYMSWKNSLPVLLNVLCNSGLSNLVMVLEYETPLGARIDAVLLGYNHKHGDQIMLFELKQWSRIKSTNNLSVVQVSVGINAQGKRIWDPRLHPLQQLLTYEKHLKQNHQGISEGSVTILGLAFLHNLESAKMLYTGTYQKWSSLKDSIFDREAISKIPQYLRERFETVENVELLRLFLNGNYVLGSAGFAGLKDAINRKENTVMIKDQVAINSAVYQEIQLEDKQSDKKLIIVSGGPGTGKTIVGLHFIYDYAMLHKDRPNAYGAVYALPRSRTVSDVIEGENGISVPFMDRISKGTHMVVIDEAHRIEDVRRDLSNLFEKANLVIVLQDDHQRIRIREHGTVKEFKSVATNMGIPVQTYNLNIQKRSGFQSGLIDRIDEMFYGEKKKLLSTGTNLNITYFDRLRDLDIDLKRKNVNGRSKWIAPFDWEWSKNVNNVDISINDHGDLFERPWNPKKLQYSWYQSKRPEDLEQVGSIYTTQGLEFDYVGLIWWDDLIWDGQIKKWRGDLSKSKDPGFVNGIIEAFGGRRRGKLVQWRGKQYELNAFLDAAVIDRRIITLLMLNTYRVLLSRATKSMGIWFKDEITRKHVEDFLKLN